MPMLIKAVTCRVNMRTRYKICLKICERLTLNQLATLNPTRLSWQKADLFMTVSIPMRTSTGQAHNCKFSLLNSRKIFWEEEMQSLHLNHITISTTVPHTNKKYSLNTSKPISQIILWESLKSWNKIHTVQVWWA